MDKVRVYSNATKEYGTIPVDEFDPKIYSPALTPGKGENPKATQKIQDIYSKYLEETNAPYAITPSKVKGFLTGESLPAIGAAGGGIIAGPAGAAIGGAGGEAVSQVSKAAYGEMAETPAVRSILESGIRKPLTENEEASNAINVFLNVVQSGVVAGVVDWTYNKLIQGVGKVFNWAKDLLTSGTEQLADIPKGTLETLASEPKEVLASAKNEGAFKNIIQTTKNAILQFWDNTSQVFQEGLDDIKINNPDLRFNKLFIEEGIDDVFERNRYSIEGLDDASQRALNSIKEEIASKADDLTIDDIRTIKQRISSLFKSPKDNRAFNRVLSLVDDVIDNLDEFPDDLKELNKWYSQRVQSFNKMVSAFDPKNQSLTLNKTESTLRGLMNSEPNAPAGKNETRALLEGIKKVTGVDVQRELEIYKAARELGTRPALAPISQPFRVAQNLLAKGTENVVTYSSALSKGVSDFIPQNVKSFLSKTLRGVPEAVITRIILDIVNEPPQENE